MLNAECFSECLCPVGCPDCSPKPLPSFPLHYFKVGDVGGTVAPVMACILLCYSLPMVKEFTFPAVSALHTEAAKKHLVPNMSLRWGYFEPLLSIVVLLSPPNQSLQSSLEIQKLRPMSSYPFCLDLHTQIPKEISGRRNPAYLICESFFLFHRLPLQTSPLHQGYEPLCLETRETKVTMST